MRVPRQGQGKGGLSGISFSPLKSNAVHFKETSRIVLMIGIGVGIGIGIEVTFVISLADASFSCLMSQAVCYDPDSDSDSDAEFRLCLSEQYCPQEGKAGRIGLKFGLIDTLWKRSASTTSSKR
jgi:hypothetical protein